MKILRNVVVIGAALGGLTAIVKIASSWPGGLASLLAGGRRRPFPPNPASFIRQAVIQLLIQNERDGHTPQRTS